MKTKLYDYQENTATDIFNRMCKNEIRGAYLGFDTGTRKNYYITWRSRKII